MDLRDMKCFYTIVEEGNISNAAKKLNMAQPPLSKQMKQLEESLGVQLFERGSRRIRLTAAGQLLRERVEQILGLVDGTVEEITALTGGVSGTLAIGSVTTAGATLLPSWIKQFHDLYPDVTFQLWEGESYRVFELLERRVIEVGIIRPPFDSSLYESITLPEEPLAIAMQEDAGRCGDAVGEIALHELAGQPMIVPLRWRDRFVDRCMQAGFKPNIVCISDGILYNLLAAKMGIGLALVPKSTEGLMPSAALVYKTIKDPLVTTQTVIIWLKNRSLSASSKHFLDLFRAGKMK